MITPVNEGTIQLVGSSNPLKNKMVLKVEWFTHDHTDSEYNSEVFDIKENQWEEILLKQLVGKVVEFDLLDEEKRLVKITFPEIPYTENDAKNIALKVWEKFSPFHYNQPQMDEFNAFWDSIKKLK